MILVKLSLFSVSCQPQVALYNMMSDLFHVQPQVSIRNMQQGRVPRLPALLALRCLPYFACREKLTDGLSASCFPSTRPQGRNDTSTSRVRCVEQTPAEKTRLCLANNQKVPLLLSLIF
jgi:hypothetical protein